MRFFATPVEDLINHFAKLPGIGRKTAQRLAFHVLDMDKTEAEKFANAILAAKTKVYTCKVCQNIAEDKICSICSNPARDKQTICVVTEPRDVITFEKTREFTGLYHVLHGTISPLNNIGPDDIKIKELLIRVKNDNVRELILATNPDTEGEATAMYISRLLRDSDVLVTRLAYGLPVGGSLDYVDEITLSRALEGRREL